MVDNELLYCGIEIQTAGSYQSLHSSIFFVFLSNIEKSDFICRTYLSQDLESLCTYGQQVVLFKQEFNCQLALDSIAQTLNSCHIHYLLRRSQHLLLCILNAAKLAIPQPGYDPFFFVALKRLISKKQKYICVDTIKN